MTIGVDGVWKRLMELAVFGIGWQTSPAGMASVWMVLFLAYLLYICWQIWNSNVKPILAKMTSNNA
jgi:hypothetical protein